MLEKEETPLQAITVSQVHAAPQPSKVNDEQLEEIMEENKRLMDEVTFDTLFYAYILIMLIGDLMRMNLCQTHDIRCNVRVKFNITSVYILS